MSLTEAQIKQYVREEVRRIIDAGLIYTETVQSKQQATVQVTVLPPTVATQQTLWESMAATAKGPWEKTSNMNTAEVQELVEKLKDKNTPIQHEGYTYWLLTNQTSHVIEGLGRRKK
jgi:hypothetical protein